MAVNGKTSGLSQVVTCNSGGDVVCANFKPSTSPLTATIQCGGSPAVNGGWVDTGTYAGKCFDSVDVYYTTNGSNVFAGTVLGSLVTGAVNLQPYSKCAGSAVLGAVKQDCAFTYVGGAMALTTDVTDNTHDDMFKIANTTVPPVPAIHGGFFEYMRLAASANDLSNPDRLHYVYRNTGMVEPHPSLAIMLPSGPKNAWTDFTRFMAHPPTGVTVEPACYPVKINVCNPVGIALPPLAGQCGPSNNGSFYNQPSSGLCAIGTMTAMAGAGPFTWTCPGLHGGGNASCAAKLKSDGMCGGSNGGNFANAPATGLCAAGTQTAVGSNPTQWVWGCTGTNGGFNASCAATIILPGQCGPANGLASATAPSSGLCTTGNVIGFSGSGPWTWQCQGNYPGPF